MIKPIARSFGVLLLTVLLAAGLVVAACACSCAVLLGGAWLALVGPKRSLLIQLLDRVSKTE